MNSQTHLSARHRCRLRRHHRRKAVVTAMVLVVLVVMAGLMAEFVRRAAGDRRQTRRDMQYHQTIRLAEAGIERLIQQQKKSADYRGETWDIPAGIIHQEDSAQVTISVQDNIATVIARYPAGHDLPNQVTRTFQLSEQATP